MKVRRRIQSVLVSSFALFLVIAFLQMFSFKVYATEMISEPALNKKSATIEVGTTLQLKVTGTDQKIKWKSSKKTIATVSSNGKIKAKKVGSTTITAKVAGKKLTCKVKVKKASKESQVVSLVNKERKKYKCGTLTTNKKLNRAAKQRAKEIATCFDHARPDGSSCFTVLAECGVGYGRAGENIAAGYDSSKKVMKGWMSSPGHRVNILDKKYNKIGVGYYKDANAPYRYYWVQIFTD